MAGVERSNTSIELDDGLKLYSTTWKPLRPSKAHLIIMHGFSDHAVRYGEFARHLCKISPIVISAFDRRGWGRSVRQPSDRGVTGSTRRILRDIDNALSFLEASQPDLPVFVMGHSMGGLDLLTYALTSSSPDLPLDARSSIKGLILNAPWVALVHPLNFLLIKAARVAARLRPNYQVCQPPKTEGVCHDSAMLQDWLDDPLCHDTVTLESSVAMVDREAALSLLTSGQIDEARKAGLTNVLPCPILWAHGSEDGAVSFESSERLCSTLNVTGFEHEKGRGTGKKFIRYEGAYHQLHAEPDGLKEKFASDIADWVTDIIA
ncbi:Serine aminopeptidase-like protein 2 [Elsinoe fawcettii]|nr:Serine aminopeptidase-like protein 2 [Elsinoe fawcettii]